MTEAAASNEVRLSTPVAELPGVGRRRAALFARLGVERVSDLLRHVPLRYEHEASETPIAALVPETIGSTRGTVTFAQWVPGRGGKVRGRLTATLEDAAGARLSLTWFNAGYLRDTIRPGLAIRVRGKVTLFRDYPQMVNPKWERLDEPDAAPPAGERLRPIYPATEDLSSAVIERVVGELLPAVLPALDDPLPEPIRQRLALPELRDACRMVHQPEDHDEAAAARRRLAFNELFLLQLGIALKRAFVERRTRAPALRFSDAIDRHIRVRFPFALTPGQDHAVQRITADLSRTRPMNRLLQGDVGSGKTAVALYAMLLAVANRRQAAMLAPTELLAEQHFLSIRGMLEAANVRVELLTAGRGSASADRAAVRQRLASGEIDIVVGTQALLSPGVRFRDLALVVIDEQHRFGVLQRAAFRHTARDAEGSAAGTDVSTHASNTDATRTVPHHLVMTATPIPRTLSLTVFGDLDVTTIRDRPAGRAPITTRVVVPEKTDEVYNYLRTRLERGEQAYVVVPTIDAAGREAARQLRNVHDHVRLLQQKYCRGFRVASVHGRLQRQTRETIMDRFRRGEVHVLVATTVIEVGVDVPNATVMIVEHAERFGLAQLHQLRGRIGRGESNRRSLCVLIAEPTTDEARRRLEAIAGTTDGFKIAELDLEIRGIGDFFGTRQHGAPPLRVARVPEDLDLLQAARREAAQLIDADHALTDAAHARLRKVLLAQYGEMLGLIDVG